MSYYWFNKEKLLKKVKIQGIHLTCKFSNKYLNICELT